MKELLYDVVAAGHICLDISPGFSGENFAAIDEILAPGKLINLDGVTISAGGPVANTGFALKKIGMRVKPIANVGQDLLGDLLGQVVNEQCGEEVSINQHISTSYSIVLSIPGIDRIILHDPAGNNEFVSDDIDYNEVANAKLFHFGYPPLMKKMYQNNGKELTAVYKKAKETGATTSLDMSLPDSSSESGKADWRSILKNTLPYVDIFLPSIEEALYMLDRAEYQRVKNKAGTNDFVDGIDMMVLPKLGEEMLAMGAKVVVIKCGSKGIYVRTAGSEKLACIGNIGLNAADWADKQFFEETYKVEKFKSALAAGDTTIAGFLSAMIAGMDIYETAKFACKTGAMCCEAYDSISGLRKINEIKERMNNETEKNALQDAPTTFVYKKNKRVWEINQ